MKGFERVCRRRLAVVDMVEATQAAFPAPLAMAIGRPGDSAVDPALAIFASFYPCPPRLCPSFQPPHDSGAEIQAKLTVIQA